MPFTQKTLQTQNFSGIQQQINHINLIRMEILKFPSHSMFLDNTLHMKLLMLNTMKETKSLSTLLHTTPIREQAQANSQQNYNKEELIQSLILEFLNLQLSDLEPHYYLLDQILSKHYTNLDFYMIALYQKQLVLRIQQALDLTNGLIHQIHKMLNPISPDSYQINQFQDSSNYHYMEFTMVTH